MGDIHHIYGEDYDSETIYYVLARLNQDGSFDSSFRSIGGGSIDALCVQPDEKILFSNYDIGLERLNQDGSEDYSFQFPTYSIHETFGYPYRESIASVITLQPNNKIITGDFLNLNRFNSDGSIDYTFNSGVEILSWINTIIIQPDGKILVGVDLVHGRKVNGIIRLTSDGNIDDSFNSGAGFNKDVKAIALQNDGKIIVGGNFNSYNGNTCNSIARLNKDGSYDKTFYIGTGFNDSVEELIMQKDGDLLVLGRFTRFNENDCEKIVRLIVVSDLLI